MVNGGLVAEWVVSGKLRSTVRLTVRLLATVLNGRSDQDIIGVPLCSGAAMWQMEQSIRARSWPSSI